MHERSDTRLSYFFWRTLFSGAPYRMVATESVRQKSVPEPRWTTVEAESEFVQRASEIAFKPLLAPIKCSLPDP
jgi:hypothetical protein